MYVCIVHTPMCICTHVHNVALFRKLIDICRYILCLLDFPFDFPPVLDFPFDFVTGLLSVD